MRLFPALALSAALLTGACTDRYGNTDTGATLGLAAGVAALGGVAYLATRDNDERPRHRDSGYSRARNYDNRGDYGNGRRGYYR